jgi:hydrogenase nickel incorporation protein HypA/HybF
MHELSVTENILSIALKHANEAKATKVTDINIVIGQLSSIIDESIQFYWDIISENTICSNAVLHFNRIPAEFLCNQCKATFKLEKELSPCPQCGSNQIKVVSGEEFYLESIEIERKE